MGFSKDTKVLTLQGFKAIKDLTEGERLPTPLGTTQVVKVYPLCAHIRAGSVVMTDLTSPSGYVEVIGTAVFLSKGGPSFPTGWGSVANKEDLNYRKKIGEGYSSNFSLHPESFDYEELLSPDSICTLSPNLRDPFVTPLNYFEDGETWVISTVNSLAVIGPLIALVPDLSMVSNKEQRPATDVRISDADLTLFQRYFQAQLPQPPK